ncbi:hypothetical protein K474DRAFT_1394651 [Panus rudis PR-1116 ss-1]|nr:hypothetical protein K474DRAFT_1394651 [Panus rudis PR-1116 ss-1]
MKVADVPATTRHISRIHTTQHKGVIHNCTDYRQHGGHSHAVDKSLQPWMARLRGLSYIHRHRRPISGSRDSGLRSRRQLEGITSTTKLRTVSFSSSLPVQGVIRPKNLPVYRGNTLDGVVNAFFGLLSHRQRWTSSFWRPSLRQDAVPDRASSSGKGPESKTSASLVVAFLPPFPPPLRREI